MILQTIMRRAKGQAVALKNKISMRMNWFDISHRIDTGVFVDSENLQDSIDSENKINMHRYGPTDMGQLKKSLNRLLSIDRTVLESAFIDFGCGKGRVLIVAEHLGFKKVVGVEFSKDLCRICEDNLKKVGSVVSQVACQDAATYQLSGDIRTFYFNTPFENCVLDKVLKNIQDYLKARSGTAYIVYVDPRKFVQLDPKEYELLEKDDAPNNPFHIYKIRSIQRSDQ